MDVDPSSSRLSHSMNQESYHDDDKNESLIVLATLQGEEEVKIGKEEFLDYDKQQSPVSLV